MGVFDLFKVFNRAEPAKSSANSARKDLLQVINRRQLHRVRQDIQRWRGALAQAERTNDPKRVELIRLYNDLVLDAHLSAVMSTRINSAIGQPFSVIKDGQRNDELTKWLDSAWFTSLMRWAIEAQFYGYSLVQILERTPDGFTKLELVPREYVRPELNSVSQEANGGKLTDFTATPYCNWTLYFGQTRDMGLLNKTSPYVLWKKNALAAWAEFSEIFGMPMRIGYVSGFDDEKHTEMEAALRQMGTAAYAVFGGSKMENEIEFLESKSTDAFEVYDRLVNRCNTEISKLVLGQTMTTDEGGSLSQSQVHERVGELYTSADLRLLRNAIKQHIFPLLVRHGFPFADCDFEFENDRQKEHEEAIDFDRIVKLKQAGYHVPEAEIQSRFNIPVQAAPPVGGAGVGKPSPRP